MRRHLSAPRSLAAIVLTTGVIASCVTGTAIAAQVPPTHVEQEGLRATVSRDGTTISLCLDVVAERHLNGPLGITVSSPAPERFATRLPMEISTGGDFFTNPVLVTLALADVRVKVRHLSVEAGVCGEDSCDPVTLKIELPRFDTAIESCSTAR